jgi:serine protease AprX
MEGHDRLDAGRGSCTDDPGRGVGGGRECRREELSLPHPPGRLPGGRGARVTTAMSRSLKQLSSTRLRRPPSGERVPVNPPGRDATPLRRMLLLAAAALAVLAAPAGAAHAAPAAQRVVVVERAPASPAAERVVRRLGGTVGRRLPIAGAFAARVPHRALPALRRARSVAGVASDARVRMRSLDDCATNDPLCFDALPAESAWQRAVGLNFVANKYQGDTGAVASIDTGVTPNPNLGARLLARVDLTAERDGLDRFGHGTHMAGLIAGDGTTSSEAFTGAAPEARIVSVKVAGWDGATDVSTVIAGLQWVVSNRSRFGIRVVNLSWGTDANRAYGVDPLDRAVERAWEAGLVVIVSAGNSGPTAGTIAKPADDPYVITVGAADVNGTAQPADDTVAPFSSRGPTADGVAKPDLVAPGVSLVSDRAPGSTVDDFRPAARFGASLFKGTGTSQAAAVVAGVVARMLDVNAALTNDQIKGVLMATADPRVAGDGAGAGLLDAQAAVAAVEPPKRGRLVVPVANGGLRPSAGGGPIEGSRGTQHVVTDLDGDGLADALEGEVDALGRAWDAAAFSATPWTATTWAASPWAPLASESSGAAADRPAAPVLAWDPAYWGARSWPEAGWDAKFWGAKFWGAKFWGTGLWQ